MSNPILDDLDVFLLQNDLDVKTAAVAENKEAKKRIKIEEEEQELVTRPGRSRDRSQGLRSIPFDSISSHVTMQVRDTKILIAAVQLDDSGSMKDDGKDVELRKGIKEMAKGFQETARKGKDVLLILKGFKGYYYYGSVLDFDAEEVCSVIYCNHDCTPLVASSSDLADTTNEVCTIYRNKGINVNVCMLILTDGRANDDRSPGAFVERVKKYRHWKIFANGITSSSFPKEQVDRVFSEMGINRRSPKNAGELAQAMFEFSQSASAF